MKFSIKLIATALAIATITPWNQLKAMNEEPKNTWFIENEFEEDVFDSPYISEEDDIFESSDAEKINKITKQPDNMHGIQAWFIKTLCKTQKKQYIPRFFILTKYVFKFSEFSTLTANEKIELVNVIIKIAIIAHKLEENQSNPAAVLHMIDELAKTYGSYKGSMSALFLEAGLATAKISLTDITTANTNCIGLICDGTFKSEHYLDCIKIILDAGDKQTIYELITMPDNDGMSSWDKANCLKDKNIIELLKEWCNKNDIITELDQLLSTDSDQSKIERRIAQELKNYDDEPNVILRLIELEENRVKDNTRNLLQQIAEEIKSLLSSRPWYHGIMGESKEEKLKINDLINNFINNPTARLIRLPSIYQLKIEYIASQLKKYQRYPQLVLRMIDKLAKTYGSGDGTISALLLKAGLKKAKMSLADIIETRLEENCLHLVYSYRKERLDCVPIILDAGDTKSTYHLIAEQKDWGHKSAWDRACIEENQDLITIFSDWARKNSIKLVKKEFFKFSPNDQKRGSMFGHGYL